MNWDNPSDRNFWSGEISNRAAKEELGRQIAEKVEDGEVIGVGSGSTSWIAIHAIAERVRREGLSVTTVCTSQEVTMACIALDLPVASLLQRRPDWAFDGADEVDPDRNLIKGRGGAMFMEKIVMHASPRNFILVDESKLVTRLGAKFPVPIEVLPVALRLVEHELAALGAVAMALRAAVKKDGPVITEHGNFILDVRFREIHKSLERDIKAVPGVIESGLFMGRDVEIVVART
ncbi:MAG TPA: ribose 5-phosphate isomerase A [Bryobacteraceae bacterium]|jgi:ribose 5-phosphate isomerase A|nr:ribose 5-phosphate isomerase A [Bryobacteraceae bacterium]